MEMEGPDRDPNRALDAEMQRNRNRDPTAEPG